MQLVKIYFYWFPPLCVLTQCYSVQRSAPSICEPVTHHRSAGPWCSAGTRCIWWSSEQRCNHRLFVPARGHGLCGSTNIDRNQEEKEAHEVSDSCTTGQEKKKTQHQKIFLPVLMLSPLLNILQVNSFLTYGFQLHLKKSILQNMASLQWIKAKHEERGPPDLPLPHGLLSPGRPLRNDCNPI